MTSRLSGTAAVLTLPAFLVATALLLLNDWVLKPTFGNWVTGKLSDVAGLAAFSLFWVALFPQYRRRVLIMTGAAFVLWKSPVSEPVIEAWNALGLWPIARVQDYSDLLALAILVPTSRLLRTMSDQTSAGRGTIGRRIGATATAITAMLSFTATSFRHPVSIDPLKETTYLIPGSRDQILAALDSLRIPISDRPRRPSAAVADTMEVDIRHPPERWLTVTIEVRDAGPGQSQVCAIALWPLGPPVTPEGMRQAFLVQVVQPLRDWLARPVDSLIQR